MTHEGTGRYLYTQALYPAAAVLSRLDLYSVWVLWLFSVGKGLVCMFCGHLDMQNGSVLWYKSVIGSSTRSRQFCGL